MRVHLFCERDGGLHTYAYICVVVQVWQSSLEDGTRMQTHTHTCIQTTYASNVRHIHACISIRFRIHIQYVCACKCTNAIAPPPLLLSLSLFLCVCACMHNTYTHTYIQMRRHPAHLALRRHQARHKMFCGSTQPHACARDRETLSNTHNWMHLVPRQPQRSIER